MRHCTLPISQDDTGMVEYGHSCWARYTDGQVAGVAACWYKRRMVAQMPHPDDSQHTVIGCGTDIRPQRVQCSREPGQRRRCQFRTCLKLNVSVQSFQVEKDGKL